MIEDSYEKLRCPKRGKTGMASVAMPKGRKTPTVESLPRGFTVVKTRTGPDFICKKCGIPVE